MLNPVPMNIGIVSASAYEIKKILMKTSFTSPSPSP
jgi:hypothetical protein